MATTKSNLLKCISFILLFSLANARSISKEEERLFESRAGKAGCTINLSTSSPANPPHLIDTDNQIILPIMSGSSRVINLEPDQQFYVGCLGSGNYIKLTGMQLASGYCTPASSLVVDGNDITSFSQLGCLQQNKEVLIENGTCANGPGTVIRIGFEAGPVFIPLYDTCHDKVAAANYFSTHYLHGKTAAADDTSNQRPSFSQGGYFPGLNVDNLYSQATQTATIAQIVGSTSLASQYVVSGSQIFLSRGHMAPDGDFIDAASQDATYYFLNTAPQWQCFNGANWNVLENRVRTLAISRDVELKVYTGTFGITTLADINGVQQPIYLAFDENNNGLIPVPKYYWKLIHDTASNTATAVVGINNPHNRVTADDVFCPDVCNQIPWVDWTLTDIVKGYTFCCTAADLYKAIDFAPNLDVPLLI